MTAPPVRLLSLDAFRGITIALMVLVNTPGDGDHVYSQLRHVRWHGWTITDLVFPSFVWIVGVALALTLPGKLAKGQTRSQLVRVALRRSAILFGLGVLLYAIPSFDPATFRILGVLQRIAICYFASVLAFLYLPWRGIAALAAGLLLGYWALLWLVPAPGFAVGNLTLEGNLAHYVDRVVLGAHNYSHTKTWDPEGVLSTIPAIGTCLLGIIAQALLRRPRELAALGAGLLATGLVWNTVFPINKMIWTSSYVCFAAGIDALLLAMLVWLIDQQGHAKPFTPFLILGSNAIAIYLSSEFLDVFLHVLDWKDPIYTAVFAPLASPINASLLYAVAYVLVNFAFAWFLWSRRWFLRI